MIIAIIDGPESYCAGRNRRYDPPWLSHDVALLFAQTRHNNKKEGAGGNITINVCGNEYNTTISGVHASSWCGVVWLR